MCDVTFIKGDTVKFEVIKYNTNQYYMYENSIDKVLKHARENRINMHISNIEMYNSTVVNSIRFINSDLTRDIIGDTLIRNLFNVNFMKLNMLGEFDRFTYYSALRKYLMDILLTILPYPNVKVYFPSKMGSSLNIKIWGEILSIISDTFRFLPNKIYIVDISDTVYSDLEFNTLIAFSSIKRILDRKKGNNTVLSSKLSILDTIKMQDYMQNIVNLTYYYRCMYNKYNSYSTTVSKEDTYAFLEYVKNVIPITSV